MTPQKPENVKKMWRDIQGLYGAWADRDDIDDAWLEDLRASWNRRYKAIALEEEQAATAACGLRCRHDFST